MNDAVMRRWPIVISRCSFGLLGTVKQLSSFSVCMNSDHPSLLSSFGVGLQISSSHVGR